MIPRASGCDLKLDVLLHEHVDVSIKSDDGGLRGCLANFAAPAQEEVGCAGSSEAEGEGEDKPDYVEGLQAQGAEVLD